MTYLQSHESIGIPKFLGTSSALLITIYGLFWCAMLLVRIHPDKPWARRSLLGSFYFFGVSPFLLLVLTFFGVGLDTDKTIGYYLMFPCGLAISAASYFHYSRV